MDDETAEPDVTKAANNNETKFMKKLFICALVIVLYSVGGGGMFFMLESPAQLQRWETRRLKLMTHRAMFIEEIRQLINRTDLEILMDIRQLVDTNDSTIYTNDNINGTFESHLLRHADQFMSRVLGSAKCTHELTWDIPNAILYAWTLITTIGYGHLYPSTTGGRIATMLYALFGIPLMLMCLSDLGKLLTRIMKLPWFITKLLFRRVFRCCLGLTWEQIRAAEQRDKADLEVFDLPVPVAIAIVVGWTFVCSAVQMIWEREWDYLVAFYFFFISLTTIGLGDVAPSDPHALLMLFVNILIGLSLLSMSINLIHSKFEHAAERSSTTTTAESKKSSSSLSSAANKNSLVGLQATAAAVTGIGHVQEKGAPVTPTQDERTALLSPNKHNNNKPSMKVVSFADEPPSTIRYLLGESGIRLLTAKPSERLTLALMEKSARRTAELANANDMFSGNAESSERDWLENPPCQTATLVRHSDSVSKLEPLSKDRSSLNESFYDNYHLVMKLEQEASHSHNDNLNVGARVEPGLESVNSNDKTLTAAASVKEVFC